jgi:hypothetical protein
MLDQIESALWTMPPPSSSELRSPGPVCWADHNGEPVRSQSAIDLETTFHNRQSQPPELQVRSTTNTARTSKHPIGCSRSTRSNLCQTAIDGPSSD